MNKHGRGLTLIEAMVALAVMALLMGLAAPALRAYVVRWAAESAVTTFLTDVRFTRSEAIKRNHFVTICRSLDGQACAPGAGSWHTGWLVFVDPDADGVVQQAEDILRVQKQLPWVKRIESQPASNTASSLRFRPTGLAIAAMGNLLLTADASTPGGTLLLCLSASGRVQPRPGQASC